MISEKQAHTSNYGIQVTIQRLLYLYILTFPFFGFSLLNVAGRGLLRLDWLVGVLIIMLFLLESLRSRLKIATSFTNILMAFYILSGILSGINVLGATALSPFVDFATKGLQLLLVTPVFFAIGSLPPQINVAYRLLRTWVITGLLVSIHAIYQLVGQVFNLPFTTFTLSNPTVSGGVQSARTLFGFTQPTSIFQEPSYMGAFLGPCLVIAIVFVLGGKGQIIFFRRNWQNWMLLIVIALAILLSNSQAILASVLAALFWIFLQGLIRRIRLLQLVVVATAALVIAGIVLRFVGIDFLTAFATRTTYLWLNIIDPENTGQVTSFANRWERMGAGIDVWFAHPIFGAGLGNMLYHTDVYDWSNSPWIQLLAEQGLVGVSLLGMLFIVLFYNLNSVLRYLPKASPWHPVVVAMLFLLVLTAVDGFFTLNWTHPQRMFTLGLINWVAIRVRQVVVADRVLQREAGQQGLINNLDISHNNEISGKAMA